MAQAMPRYCPRCGTPTRANMRYCATCELPVEAMLSRPDDKTAQSWSGESAGAVSQGATPEPATIPTPTPGHMQQEEQLLRPPLSSRSQDFRPSWDVSAEETLTTEVPPAPGTWNAPGNSPIPPAEWNARANPSNPSSQSGIPPWAAPQAEPRFSPAPDPWSAPGNPPSGAGTQAPWIAPAEPMGPPHVPTPQSKGRRRLGLLIVLLVVLLALGGGGYLVVSLLGGHSQSAIKTSNLNLAVTYAGLDVTLVNVQQAQNFIDDPQSASDGMLRLNLREQNKTTIPIYWNYNTSARLIVQGKPSLAPTYVKSKQSIAPGTTQTSIIDFVVPNGGNLNSTIFQLGAANEAQMRIPLAGQPDLSQYQPKSTAQNGTMVYFGLNWTLTGATTSLSIPGQQASKGMEYLTLNLKVDNTLSQEAISGSPFDYMRVKAGGQTVAPVATTVPVSFDTGATGKTGTATFLIPQNSATCTLILLSQDPGGSGQASIDFKI